MTDSSTSTHSATEQDLAKVITELEQYRERLISDTLTTVQRAKLPKTKAMTLLEPELAKIDAMLQSLNAQRASLQDPQ
jgi:hypothetical protein